MDSSSRKRATPPVERTDGSSKRLKTSLKKIATGLIMQAADTAKIGPLNEIFDLMQSFGDMCIMEGTAKNEHEALQQRLQAMLKILDKHSGGDDLPMTTLNITEIREFIENELSSIENKQNGKQRGQFRMAKGEEERFLACCSRVQGFMDELTLDTRLLTHAEINKMREEQTQNHLLTGALIDEIKESQLKDQISSRVSRLPSSSSACYNSRAGEELKRRGCTPGTRIDVLANLLSWVDGASNNGGVYWLNGMAGTGKTTIAYSVCKELDSGLELAASFFCSRLREECRDVNVII
ncbi:unnamed protein product, partial [Rhizoctonia solani]